MFKKKINPIPIFSINYFGDMNFDISFIKNLTSDDASAASSFLYLLTYHSPIGSNIIDKIISNKNSGKYNHTNIDCLLKSWSSIYLSNKNDPIVSPLTTFKNNAK